MALLDGFSDRSTSFDELVKERREKLSQQAAEEALKAAQAEQERQTEEVRKEEELRAERRWRAGLLVEQRRRAQPIRDLATEAATYLLDRGISPDFDADCYTLKREESKTRHLIYCNETTYSLKGPSRGDVIGHYESTYVGGILFNQDGKIFTMDAVDLGEGNGFGSYNKRELGAINLLTDPSVYFSGWSQRRIKLPDAEIYQAWQDLFANCVAEKLM